MNNIYTSTQSVNVKCLIDKLWLVLTSAETIKIYFNNQYVKTDWVIGHPIYWGNNLKNYAYADKGEVLEFEPRKVLSFSHWSPLTGSEDKSENYQVISFQLTPLESATNLRLVISTNSSQREADQMARTTWKKVLLNIKQLAESA